MPSQLLGLQTQDLSTGPFAMLESTKEPVWLQIHDDTSLVHLLKETESRLTDHTISSNETNVSSFSPIFSFDEDVLDSKACRRTMRTLMKKDKAVKVSGPEEQLSSSLAVQKISPDPRPVDDVLPQQQMNTDVFWSDSRSQRLLLKLDRTLTDHVEAGDIAGLTETMLDAVDLDIPSKWFPFSLRKAIETSQLEAVSELLNMGIESESIDGFSRTPLSYACSKGQLEVVDFLRHRGASIAARNVLGETPLHEASYLQHTALMASLLSWGADVNARDARGDTPLHHACSPCEAPAAAAAAALLLTHGALPSARNFHGQTPVSLALLSANAPALRVLLNDPSLASSIKSTLDDHLSFTLKHIATEEQHIADSTGFSPSKHSTAHLHASTTLLIASMACLALLLDLAPRWSRSVPLGSGVRCAWEEVEFESVPEGIVGIVGSRKSS
ncbi:ankyrin [Pseudovirgaria hyperparasitica]|uniref:Ankyrin n=1 Tax=Pseudovirgaria hyperparasitica TaxID=470096 RepID=A0A6A6WK26_9PEZI|nr:ankyrin [Pseudovirgaria hyperparasitica]KAF2762141.1 ankyrin [Pseudovirgaria hyperparasitica]